MLLGKNIDEQQQDQSNDSLYNPAQLRGAWICFM